MLDLHTHTYFSDGLLGPSELVYRAKHIGYTAIGLTDHGDFSNMELTIKSMLKVAPLLEKEYKITVLPGIELSYVPPRLIAQAVRMARRLGAQLVLVHGETPVENVPPGTNKAAIASGIDILAHPGYINRQDTLSAKKNNVMLEISSRHGHLKGNSHVAALAQKAGAGLVFNTDTHAPGDLIDTNRVNKIIQNAQLSMKDFKTMQGNALKLIKRIRG